MVRLPDRLRARLGSGYPSGSSPYWRDMPLRHMTKLLAGTFLTAAGVGFAVDFWQLNHPPLGSGLFWPLLGGATATSMFVARIRTPRLALPIWMAWLVLIALALRAAHLSTPIPLPAGLLQRARFDVVGAWLSAGLAFRLLLSFITGEGLDRVRMQTELALAHDIQATLVPDISRQTGALDVYGKSFPSTEMGGDLIDIVDGESSVLAYVADVSGHGLSAGQLMGMLKTAVRISLQFRQGPVGLLESVDRVLPAVKEPSAYATLALLHFDGPMTAEYASAGHIPILHYRESSRDIVRLSMQQFPLGLLPGGMYESQRVTYSAGDMFLMFTDGVSEVPNTSDEEFGLPRLESALAEHADQPVARICDLIMDEVRRHGPQKDDQTLLLIRVRQ